jgi:hypothetical protein
VLAIPVVLSSIFLEVVTPSTVEQSPVTGAIVAIGPPSPPTAYGAEDGAYQEPSQGEPIVATIAFMNDDGSIGSLSCPTRAAREDSVYFPDAAQAMDVYARLCARD